MIRGITFAEQIFYSKDFAHYQDLFLNHNNGITRGCVVTNTTNTVTISPGYFVVQGRFLNVETAEVIESAFFKTGYNRIVYEIDLSKENTITEFKQGAVKVLDTDSLIQEDLFGTGKVYQLPFCHFQWNGSAISDFVTDAPTINLDNIFAQISANYDSFNTSFQTWFNAQKNSATSWIDTQKSNFTTYSDGKKTEIQNLVNNAQDILDSLEAGVYSTTTLLASGWSSGVYSFESTYPHAEYDIEIQPSDSINTTQLEAWNSALIVGSATANKYTVKGTVPTVDIPIIIKAMKRG